MHEIGACVMRYYMFDSMVKVHLCFRGSWHIHRNWKSNMSVRTDVWTWEPFVMVDMNTWFGLSDVLLGYSYIFGTSELKICNKGDDSIKRTLVRKNRRH